MKLSINVDHIATLRNARGGNIPDPVEAALICEKAGADGIVCHLREDRRHIKDDDVFKLRKSIQKKLDLEMAATEEIIGIAVKVKPDLVTLVPERRQELTTEGGLDIVNQKKYYESVIKKFHENGILVSLFVEPEIEQIKASVEIGTDMVELHTGHYAESKSEEELKNSLNKIEESAKLGKSLGIGVNAGHGLDYDNIIDIVRIKEINEVSIGYAVIVRAMFVGLENAVSEMVRLVKGRSAINVTRADEEE